MHELRPNTASPLHICQQGIQSEGCFYGDSEADLQDRAAIMQDETPVAYNRCYAN